MKDLNFAGVKPVDTDDSEEEDFNSDNSEETSEADTETDAMEESPAKEQPPKDASLGAKAEHKQVVTIPKVGPNSKLVSYGILFRMFQSDTVALSSSSSPILIGTPFCLCLDPQKLLDRPFPHKSWKQSKKKQLKSMQLNWLLTSAKRPETSSPHPPPMLPSSNVSSPAARSAIGSRPSRSWHRAARSITPEP